MKKILSKRVLAEESILDMGINSYQNSDTYTTMSKEYVGFHDPKLYDQYSIDRNKNNTYSIKNNFENVPSSEPTEREKNQIWILSPEK